MSLRASGKSSVLGRFASFTAFSLLTLIVTASAFGLWFDRSYSAHLRAILHHTPPVLTVLSADGHVLTKRGTRSNDISLKDLPSSLIEAVIATEDRRFFSHSGIDPRGFLRAVWNNISKGRLRQGGSTITQQLVKNVFLTRKRTLTRKFRELVISFWLEAHYSKQQILEHYFNRVYFGSGGRHGIEAAAQYFFNTSAKNLDLPQSAMLAGLLKAPSYYSPRKNLVRSRARTTIVLENMVANHSLTIEQAQQAHDHPAELQKPVRQKKPDTGTEYAVDWIMDRLHHHIGRVDRDLVVTTTLDYNWQVKSQQMLKDFVNQHHAAKNIDQAAAVLMDASGGIKLMTGGTSYQKSQFNRVTMALRQPGSAFKPVVFLAALEDGRTANSIVNDENIKIEGWRPRNYARFHRGPVTMRKALAGSINSVAAKLADEVGLERVIRTAKRLGIHTPLKKRPSLALGSSEVTVLEMTGAYVPFMNGGYEATPHIITQVSAKNGEVLYAAPQAHTTRIIERRHVYEMNDMLGAVMRSGTGKRAQLEGHNVAGKTGTTTDYRDAWFIGYSGWYTAGIWTGNDDNSSTNEASGGQLPALLWKQIMQMALQGKTSKPLPGLRPPHPLIVENIIVRRTPPPENIIVQRVASNEALLTDKLSASPLADSDSAP